MTFLGTKNVDDIVGMFAKTVLDLKNRAEEMKEKIKNEQDVIEKSKQKQKGYALEGLRAESISKKLADVIT